jgi:ribosomal protein L7Ae-like RNA K-turn-binding protein
MDVQLTLHDALHQVCRISGANDKLVKGFRQVTKRIMSKEAQLVLLSSACIETISERVVALAKMYSVPLIKVDTREDLGRLVGFEKFSGTESVKVSKCGVACITDYCGESEGKVFIMNALRSADWK